MFLIAAIAFGFISTQKNEIILDTSHITDSCGSNYFYVTSKKADEIRNLKCEVVEGKDSIYTSISCVSTKYGKAVVYIYYKDYYEGEDYKIKVSTASETEVFLEYDNETGEVNITEK